MIVPYDRPAWYFYAICQSCWGSKSVTLKKFGMGGPDIEECTDCGGTGRDAIPWAELFMGRGEPLSSLGKP